MYEVMDDYIYYIFEDENGYNVFLIDCTGSSLTDKEILERINIIFISSKNDFIKAIIIKNNSELFVVFKKI